VRVDRPYALNPPLARFRARRTRELDDHHRTASLKQRITRRSLRRPTTMGGCSTCHEPIRLRASEVLSVGGNEISIDLWVTGREVDECDSPLTLANALGQELKDSNAAYRTHSML
jgi:hypothetical protein